MAKREKKRLFITLDSELVAACDMFLDRLAQEGSFMRTKSDLITQALNVYFDKLTTQLEAIKGGKEHAN